MSTIPYAIEQTSRGERSYDIFSKLLFDRIVFLGEEVSDVSASLIIARMPFLGIQGPEEDIQLYINDPGGSVSAGFTTYDITQYIKCDVSATCIGLAVSLEAFLLAGGARGKRIALSNVEIMTYQPAIHGNGIQGQATDIKTTSDHTQKSKKRLDTILAENTGKSTDEVAIATERDSYIAAEEAMNSGLIDKIVDRRRMFA